MVNTNIFVDSNDLVDLEKIFEEGVLKSEMIVLLGTTGVLTRPWCLLELYEARRHQIPVVTFAMSAHAFTPASARAHMHDLKSKLPEGAEELIREHLLQNPLNGGSPDSWERLSTRSGITWVRTSRCLADLNTPTFHPRTPCPIQEAPGASSKRPCS